MPTKKPLNGYGKMAAAIGGIILALLVNGFAFAFSYGRITSDVSAVRADVQRVSAQVATIDSKLDNQGERVAVLEVKLDLRDNKGKGIQ